MTRRRLVTVGLAALVALSACTTAEEEPTGPPTAIASPVASPSEATPDPDDATPTPGPSPAPSPSATTSPSPAATPSPDASPELTEAAALAAARRYQEARGDCDGGIAAGAHRVVTTVDERLLVHVVCFVGAYQASGELRVWDGVDLVALPVEQWQSGAVVDTPEVVGFVEGSPGSTTVTNQVLYRGLGDCGLQQRWEFDGSALRLELARERQCTDDGEFVPPTEWPVVHRG